MIIRFMLLFAVIIFNVQARDLDINAKLPGGDYVLQNIENPQNGEEVIVSSKITNTDQVELMITNDPSHFNFISYDRSLSSFFH